MSIGDALSKSVTYADVEDLVRLRTNMLEDATLTPSLMLKEISLSVQKIAAILNQAGMPHYLTTSTAYSIEGSENPYYLDISGISPYIDTIVRLVHVNSAGTRTLVRMVSTEEAERRIGAMTNIHASSLLGVWEGDSIRLYKGSLFTITIATDTTELKYMRMPIVASVTRASYLDVPDKFTQLVIDDVITKVLRHKHGGEADTKAEATLVDAIANITNQYQGKTTDGQS